MDIYAMHVLFRTLGQQQGLQLIRGILSESIDNFLNEAIVQTARIEILGNVQPFGDVKTPQYTKLSPISSFHNLFCTEQQTVDLSEEGDEIVIELNKVPICVTNFVIQYRNSDKCDCRLIETERLHQTLKDYLNRASYDYPITSLINGDKDNRFTVALFTGGNQRQVERIITTYVRMPKVVRLDEDNYGQPNDTSVNCDLPEHLHHLIVELAVEIWFKSLGLTSQQPQENNNNKNTK